jgi:hypothetical protein
MRFSYRVLGLALIAMIISACDTISGAKIDELETKNAQYQATIDAIGTPHLTVIALEQYATQNVVLQARLSQAENESLAARATLTVLEMGGASGVQITPAAPDVAAVQPGPQIQPQETPIAGGGAAITPTPGTRITASNGVTQFSQTVTATGLDSSDCAVGVTSVFDPSEDMIYVNTRIDFLPSGSQLSAKWTVNGELYLDDTQCWIPNQDYSNICAYCTVTPNSGAFTAGDWTVELLLDGQSMAQTTFQVAGAGAPADTGSETSWKGN